MELRFWTDPETDLPHIYNHGVTEEEVRQVLSRPGLIIREQRDARSIMGQTTAGRHLKVVFVPDRTATAGSLSPPTSCAAKP